MARNGQKWVDLGGIPGVCEIVQNSGGIVRIGGSEKSKFGSYRSEILGNLVEFWGAKLCEIPEMCEIVHFGDLGNLGRFR